MTKSAKKRSTAKSATSSKRSKSTKVATKHVRMAVRSGTKQSAAIEMLRAGDGATIESLTKATGWQQHSVRGFLAGVVRKRLKLDLESAVIDGVRTYWIAGERGAESTQTKQVGQS